MTMFNFHVSIGTLTLLLVLILLAYMSSLISTDFPVALVADLLSKIPSDIAQEHQVAMMALQKLLLQTHIASDPGEEAT